jgi:hypothetical protein
MKINHPALTWSTEDIRASVDQLQEADQKKFYQIAGESNRDLRTYFECLLDERKDMIIQYIYEQIADAIAETLE